MFELEEMLQQLKELEKKLKELGESLWHRFERESIARIGIKNTGSRFLDRYRKFNKGFARNESIEK